MEEAGKHGSGGMWNTFVCKTEIPHTVKAVFLLHLFFEYKYIIRFLSDNGSAHPARWEGG